MRERRRGTDPRTYPANESASAVRWTFAERMANRRLAKRLRARGKALREIADRLDCGISTVAWLLKSKRTNVARYDERIIEMRGAGRTIPEIMRTTGMSESGIYDAIKRLGLAVTPRMQGSLPAWTEKAERLRARGKPLAEIATVVGVSVARVSFVLRSSRR